LTSVVIPNGVTYIDQCAFIRCKGLISVTIPQTVSEIGPYAFEKCSELADVYCFAEEVPKTYGSNPFQDSYIEYATLHVPAASVSSYGAVEPWKNFKNIVKIDMPKHILVYMVDDEEYKKYEIEEGTSITPEAAPTKEGYIFTGWSEIPETMPAHDVTVTGTFSINKYKLIYTVDGAEYKTYEVKYGEAVTPEAEPTKEGNTFSGWSEIPQMMPAHDVTVTGSFIKKGDANSDITVNAADIVEMVNYIMGNPSDRFNNTASDMNNDGVVNDADIKEVVNIIMESE